MTKVAGMDRKVYSLIINGKPFAYANKISKIDLPTKDRPYWIIELEGGIIIYATGEVSLEVSPASAEKKPELKESVKKALNLDKYKTKS